MHHVGKLMTHVGSQNVCFGWRSIWYCVIGCWPSCQVRLQMLAIGTDRMSSWRLSVLAADAKNVGIARELTRYSQTPILHWQTGLKPLGIWRDGCDLEGEQCRRWRTLRALKDDLRRIRASCALTKLIITTTIIITVLVVKGSVGLSGQVECMCEL